MCANCYKQRKLVSATYMSASNKERLWVAAIGLVATSGLVTSARRLVAVVLGRRAIATAAVLVGALSRLGRLGTLRGSVDTASQGGNTNGRSGDLLQAQRAASLGLGGRGRSSGSQGEQSENSRELHRWLVVVEEGWRVGCWWFQAYPQAGRGSPFIPEGFPFFPSQGEMR